VEDKQASEWLLEYVLVVLKWYGVEPRHVKTATLTLVQTARKHSTNSHKSTTRFLIFSFVGCERGGPGVYAPGPPHRPRPFRK
jgi:hypothetical protein